MKSAKDKSKKVERNWSLVICHSLMSVEEMHGFV